MKKEKNILQQIITFITYKEKSKPKRFYIPEVNEGKHQTKNQTDEEAKKSDDKSNDKTGSQSNAQSKEQNRGIKKPIPVAEMRKEKNENSVKTESKQADENTVSTDIDSNIEFINKKFNAPTNKDIVIRRLTIAGKYKAFLVFLDGMVNSTNVSNFIIRPLLNHDKFMDIEEECLLDYIMENVIESNQIRKFEVPDDVISEILVGNTGLYVEGCNYYIFCDTKGFDKRGVEKPQTEGVVKGPQEAFNESLRTNITLLRRAINNSNLTTEFFRIGERTKRNLAVVYIEGLVNPAIVKEVKRRINGIKTDTVANSGVLEQFIEDSTWSIIPTTISTERPDRAASYITEGKVVIILDGTPFAIVVPATFQSLLQSPEDASLKWQHATFLRIIRLLAVGIACLLPGMYVALTTFHREMIPTDLLIAIAQAKENVPFPTLVEVIAMETAFELIREAGIRIPGIIGNTIGIIGALILGQAAVEANLVSPVLIIVIAVTGLANFAIPNFSLAFGIRLLRFFFIFTGGVLGFYGMSLAFVGLGILLVSMKSFGVPFTAPVTPRTRASHDLLIRWPVWKHELRPDYDNTLDERRQPDISRQWIQEEPEDGYDKEGDNA